jgi:hypothetical protein
MGLRLWRHTVPTRTNVFTIRASAWTNIDMQTDRSTLNGLNFNKMYCNVEPIFRAGSAGFGTIRVRFVRESGDSTAYQDFQIRRDSLISGRFLMQPQHFGQGNRTRGRWQIRCTGDITELRIRTRFVKIQVVGT